MLKCCDRFRGTELPYDDSAGYTAPPAFGPYRVLHQIGSGVLGPVFRAFESSDQELIAIKAFRLPIVPEDAARLTEALRRLAAVVMRSPHVIPLKAAGLEGATPFLAMECVAADTLDAVMRRRGPLPLDDARTVLSQVAAALDAGLANGITHGALHPRDVFVDDRSTVRVSGLGVAAALDSIGAKVTPRRPYAAPERVAGERWDQRADVYSLAVIAHELLTGRRPSGGGEQDGALPADTPAEQRVVIRRALGAALAEHPDARYSSAGAFVAALETGVVPAAVTPAVALTLPLDAEPPDAPDPPDLMDLTDPSDLKDLMDPPDPKDPKELMDPTDLMDPPDPMDPPDLMDLKSPTSVWGASSVAPQIPARTDSPRNTWAMLIVGLIVGVGIGQAWRTLSPQAPAPETTLAGDVGAGVDVSGTEVTVVDPLPVEPEPPVVAQQIPAAPSTSSAPAQTAPDRGRLLVRSVPAGAEVMVAGRPRGTTPAAVRDLPFGTYTVTVRRDGYTARSQRVTLTRSVPARELTLELSAAASASTRTGSLSVETRPTGARLFVDDRMVGTAPIRVPELTPGSHTIRLELAGYRTLTTTVVVRAGQVNVVKVSLERM